MNELEEIKGKKIICICDEYDIKKKATKGRHNAQMVIAEGKRFPAFAFIDKALAFVTKQTKSGFHPNERIEGKRLYCECEKNPFPRNYQQIDQILGKIMRTQLNLVGNPALARVDKELKYTGE